MMAGKSHIYHAITLNPYGSARACQVLSNHQKRTVYDLHGMEGIKCMEQAAQMEARMS
jgi:hypothetical protein